MSSLCPRLTLAQRRESLIRLAPSLWLPPQLAGPHPQCGGGTPFPPPPPLSRAPPGEAWAGLPIPARRVWPFVVRCHLCIPAGLSRGLDSGARALRSLPHSLSSAPSRLWVCLLMDSEHRVVRWLIPTPNPRRQQCWAQEASSCGHQRFPCSVRPSPQSHGWVPHSPSASRARWFLSITTAH